MTLSDLSEFVWICPICFQFVWTDQTQPIQPYNNNNMIYTSNLLYSIKHYISSAPALTYVCEKNISHTKSISELFHMHVCVCLTSFGQKLQPGSKVRRQGGTLDVDPWRVAMLLPRESGAVFRNVPEEIGIVECFWPRWWLSSESRASSFVRQAI